eukprot:scaffold200105_cov18-Tisochrysis_lutea.AAC.1
MTLPCPTLCSCLLGCTLEAECTGRTHGAFSDIPAHLQLLLQVCMCVCACVVAWLEGGRAGMALIACEDCGFKSASQRQSGSQALKLLTIADLADLVRSHVWEPISLAKERTFCTKVGQDLLSSLYSKLAMMHYIWRQRLPGVHCSLSH